MEYKKRQRRRRHGNASPVSETMTSVLKKLGRHQPGIHPEIWSRWSEIVGPELAKRTIPEGFRNKTLILAVRSSAWLQELSFVKPRLLERLAEEIGPGVVTDIRLIQDPQLPVRPTPAAPPPKPQPEESRPLPPEISNALDAVADETLRESARRAAQSNLS
jgi:hypothetical protein